jgi:nitrite reductase (NADH) small subunit
MWHRIVSVNEIPPESSREFVIGDRIIALFHSGGEFHAVDGICPHAGGPLAEGKLEGKIVTCPWHGWQFDVSTGKHCLSRQIQQRCFPVRVEEGEILVDLP